MRHRKPGTKRRRKSLSAKRKTLVPGTLKEYNSLSSRLQDLWNRITHVVTDIRAERLSLNQASRKFGIDPRTVIRRAGSALEKSRTGRYVAKRSDQLLRVLEVPDHGGTREVAIRGSRRAKFLSNYWNAVHPALETGDVSGLKKFQGKSIRAENGAEIPLITDLAELKRLGHAGMLSFESIYSRST